MSDPRRGPKKPGTNRTAIIVGVAIAAAFLIYMLAYGFGGFATPDAEDRAEDVPETEQPIDEFAADEPADGAGDDPEAQPEAAPAE
jgi:hypothetical protein